MRSSLEESIARVREKSHSLDRMKRSAEEFMMRVDSSYREMLDKIAMKEQEIIEEVGKRMWALREQLSSAKANKGALVVFVLCFGGHQGRFFHDWCVSLFRS